MMRKSGHHSCEKCSKVRRLQGLAPMLHVSTRGEAPAIGFRGRAPAGLARRRRALRAGGLAGRPAGHDRGLRRAGPTRTSRRPCWRRSWTARSPTDDLGRMVDEAYASFRHPAVCPLVQLDDNLFALELFHGPTLAFKDVAMQLLGPPDGPRAQGPRRPRHHRRRDLGRHRQRRRRGLPRPRPGRHLHPLPARPRLGGAAPADDHRRRPRTSTRSRSRAPSTTARTPSRRCSTTRAFATISGSRA